jgi:8-oxo-dGTP pyrophosphatase MutT (NUDIX family)
MRVRVPVPAPLAGAASAFLEADRAPVPAREASTVVLLRDGATGIELYLLRRQTSMAFAAGMYVFPGGGVDPRDADATIAWSGPPPAAWADRLGVAEPLARGLVAAAVRETFEESGVLLAGQSPTSVVADVSGADWEADRLALESREISLAELLSRRGLVLRTDLLGAWANWITPVFEQRRYDTWFFVAALPDGQRTRDIFKEADRVVWMAPAEAVAAVDSGAMAMLPPTYVTCSELVAAGSSTAALAAAAKRRIVPLLPQLVGSDSGPELEMDLP